MSFSLPPIDDCAPSGLGFSIVLLHRASPCANDCAPLGLNIQIVLIHKMICRRRSYSGARKGQLIPAQGKWIEDIGRRPILQLTTPWVKNGVRITACNANLIILLVPLVLIRVVKYGNHEKMRSDIQSPKGAKSLAQGVALCIKDDCKSQPWKGVIISH